MEDLTLALITLTSFVLLFVVAIFADRAGMQGEQQAPVEVSGVGDTDVAVLPSNGPVQADVA